MLMAIYKGSNKVVKLYKGSTPIIKRYKGTQLIYQAEDSSDSGSTSEIDLTMNSLPMPFNINGVTATANTENTIDNGDGTYTYKATLEDFGVETLTTYQQSFINTSLTKVNNLPFPNTVTNVVGMFLNCSSLVEINAEGWDISNVTSTTYMFESCTSLTKLILGSVSQTTFDWWYARLSDAKIQDQVTIEYTIV